MKTRNENGLCCAAAFNASFDRVVSLRVVKYLNYWHFTAGCARQQINSIHSCYVTKTMVTNIAPTFIIWNNFAYRYERIMRNKTRRYWLFCHHQFIYETACHKIAECGSHSSDNLSWHMIIERAVLPWVVCDNTAALSFCITRPPPALQGDGIHICQLL